MIKIGDMVSLSEPDRFNRKDSKGKYLFSTEYFGLVFGIVDDCAQVLWLSKDCHFSVHFGLDMLVKRNLKDLDLSTIDWFTVSEHVGNWFRQMQYSGSRLTDMYDNEVNSVLAVINNRV